MKTQTGVVKRKREREIGAAATAPRSVLWQRSINSSSNLSRKSHSSASAAANTETGAGYGYLTKKHMHHFAFNNKPVILFYQHFKSSVKPHIC